MKRLFDSPRLQNAALLASLAVLVAGIGAALLNAFGTGDGGIGWFVAPRLFTA
jgi:hypothetical protein